MKRSFRLYLFIQILLVTALILISNRQIAQHFLADQMRTKAHEEMARVLADCVPSMNNATDWERCTKSPTKGDVLHPLTEFFIPCPPVLDAQSAPECALLRRVQADWREDKFSNGAFSLGDVKLPSGLWYVMTAQRSLDSPQVLLAHESLWQYLRNVWALRDRNLIYVLPTIILMLMGLTAYMVYVVMRPIRVLENTLSTLDFKNIRERSVIETPYVEFKNLANVYRDLLQRLDASYENAKRFASDAAHELRTPLSILRGNLERLIPEVGHGSQTQQYVQNLSDEVDRLVLITEKLLMLARADSNSLSLDLVTVNLSEHLTELIEDAASFHPSIRFINHVQPNVTWRCDRALIEQLINNLYSNAVKYNAARGGWIEFQLRQTEQDIFLTVKNSSVDVSPELPEKAFERFYRSDASRTRRTTDGLGLGLSICKEIAQLHGGSMTLSIEDVYVVSVTLRAPLDVPVG